MIDNGRVIAEGTSSDLKRSVGGSTLRVRIRSADRTAEAESLLRELLGPDVHNGSEPAVLTASVADDRLVGTALSALARAGIGVAEVTLGQPSLDEVFFALTGRAAEERDASGEVDA